MTEFEDGYNLGSKVPKEECKKISQEWKELENRVRLIIAKPLNSMTQEEKNLWLDYDLFWWHKTLAKTKLVEASHEMISGFTKAILERSK